jgi:hypothetical protein
MSCAANANHKFNNWTSFTALEQQQKLQAHQKTPNSPKKKVMSYDPVLSLFHKNSVVIIFVAFLTIVVC